MKKESLCVFVSMCACWSFISISFFFVSQSMELRVFTFICVNKFVSTQEGIYM